MSKQFVYPTNYKVTTTIRLHPSVKDAVHRMARVSGESLNTYMEKAIQGRLKADLLTQKARVVDQEGGDE